MYALDADTITALVNAESFARGEAYERGGMVQSFRWTRADTVIDARVKGTRPAPYRVNIMFSTDPRGLVAPTVGVCSCPVHVNCKHVAAVLLAVRRSLDGLAPASALQADWERLLAPMLEEPSEPVGRKGSPMALLLELRRSPTDSAASLSARPMTMGAKQRWIKGNTTWTNLAYGYAYNDWNARHQQILNAIYALHTAHRRFYSDDQWIRLDELPGKALWALLREADEADLHLIQGARDQEPVTLGTEPAVVTLDVSRDDGEVSLQPTVVIGEQRLAGDSVAFLGEPAQLIARWESLDDDHLGGPFELVALEKPLNPHVHALALHGQSVRIPADQEERFLADYLPRLRTSITVESTDPTLELPAPPQVTLAVTVEVVAARQVDLGCAWLYHVPGAAPESGQRRSLYGNDGFRDRAAENAILESVGLEAYAYLREHRPYLRDTQADRLDPHPSLDGADTIDFVSEVLPMLAEHPDVALNVVGEPIDYRLAEEPPVIEVATRQADGDRDWFDLAITIKIDGEEVGFQDLFRALAVGEEMMILPSGTYFSLARREFDQLVALIEEARGLRELDGDTIKISRFQAGWWDELAELGVVTEQADAWRESVSSLLKDAEMESIPPSPGLKATLRGYQQEGLDWLTFLQQHELGGILADDMGLGKTIQTLALISHVIDRDGPDLPPFLVVAPTSVVANWDSECAKFAPGLRTVVISETANRGKYELKRMVEGAQIVLTSYALFRIDFDHYEELTWSGLILDEAQFVKNHQSRAYQCARRLSTPFKLAITGTPMENNLMELWSLFSITSPGLFGGPGHFGDYYRKRIEREGDDELLAQLRRRIRPLMLRRTKEQVASHLPPKQEQVKELELFPNHRKVYKKHLQRERQKVLGLIDDLDSNRFAIFRSLTILRQLSLDASLYDDKYADIPSTKLAAMEELITEILAENHRVLIFSQFTGFLGRVRDLLEARKVPYAYLDGRTKDRGAVIESFKSGDAPVFLISLKAGGFGLNLTEADYCILLDPWWNPATEAQAIDRVHRIGQTKNVMVYRLVAKDTIEEKVMALKEGKAKLFASVMDDGGAAGSKLTAAEIRELLT